MEGNGNHIDIDPPPQKSYIQQVFRHVTEHGFDFGVDEDDTDHLENCSYDYVFTEVLSQQREDDDRVATYVLSDEFISDREALLRRPPDDDIEADNVILDACQMYKSYVVPEQDLLNFS